MKTKVIGITGGIGTGKSTISDYIKKMGYVIIDADEIARDITNNDDQVIDELSNAFKSNFNDDILLDKGVLNRKLIAKLVFEDLNKKEVLENIVTKRVINICKDKIEKIETEFVFLDAPLLFETNMNELCYEIWVVTAKLETRISRVMQRDNITEEEVLARINNQLSEDYKISKASKVIYNDKSKNELYKELDKILSNIR